MPRGGVVAVPGPVRLEPVSAAGRHQRPREDVGGDHRKRHGHRHWHEQESPQPGRHHQRRKHQERAERRDQLGHRHLAGAQERRLMCGRPQPQVPVRVLEADDRAIDHRADRQCHPRQRHHVDRLPREVQATAARHDRNRQRHDRDRRHPQLAQKEQDHQRAQNRPQHPFLHQRLDRLPHVDRLVHDRLQGDSRFRQLFFEPLQRVFQGLHHLERAGPELPVNRNINFPPAVDAHDVRLNVIRIPGGRDVFQIHSPAVFIAERNIPHVPDGLIHRIGIEHVVEVADLGIAAGQKHVGGIECVHDVQRRKPPRLNLLPVEVGHHRPDLAAVDHRRNRSRNSHDHITNFVTAHVIKHRFIVGRVLAVDRHDAHRGHRSRVERQNDRRQSARRQVGNHPKGQRVHLSRAPRWGRRRPGNSSARC